MHKISIMFSVLLFSLHWVHFLTSFIFVFGLIVLGRKLTE